MISHFHKILISTLISYISPVSRRSFRMVKRFDHSRLFERIFDRSYRIKRQSLSRKFIVIHIPLHISRPNLSLPSTCRPLPHCSTRTDNNEDAFYTEGIKKRKREIHSRRGDLRVRNNETRRIYRKRRCCSILVTTARRAPPFLFFSFFLSLFLSLPLFPFLFFFSPQHPRSLWGTHYRCSFHVISESQLSPFRATLQARRLSICGRAWIFFFPFYSPFYFFFHPLFISRFATCQNPFGILIRQILIRYWINVHNESFFFFWSSFIFIYRFLYYIYISRAKRGRRRGREYNFRENWILPWNFYWISNLSRPVFISTNLGQHPVVSRLINYR